MKTKLTILLLMLLFTYSYVRAQVSHEISSKEKDQVNKTINQYKTDNTKEILTTFLRAALNNINGKDKSFNLNTTLFAIDSLLNFSVSEPSNFIKQTSVDFKLKANNENSISDIYFGFTTPIINNKNLKYKRLDKEDFNILEKNANIQLDIKKELTINLPEDEINAFDIKWNNAKKKGDFADFTEEFTKIDLKKIVSKYLQDEEYNNIVASYTEGKDPFRVKYKEIAEKYSRKLLWTISPAMLYDRENKQANYFFTTKLTKGISKNLQKKPWEIEINATFRVSNDTLKLKTNYDNKIGLINIGINKVILEDKDNQPKMEFKFFTEYEHQFGSSNNFNNIFTLNSTLRINLFKTVWLPITIKYDPENGSIFGFFSIAANLSDS